MGDKAERVPFRKLPLAQQAGILSGGSDFQRFAGERCCGLGTQFGREATAQFIRRECGIESRAELNTDPTAMERFLALRTDFDAWRGHIARPR